IGGWRAGSSDGRGGAAASDVSGAVPGSRERATTQFPRRGEEGDEAVSSQSVAICPYCTTIESRDGRVSSSSHGEAGRRQDRQ
ncbi:unnamed protein product, partial [Laminaria digitata]